MSSHYFHRNSGVPLLVKLGVLAAAFYLIFLFLKLFTLILGAFFALLKFFLPVVVVAAAVIYLVKVLFGIDLLRRNKQNPRYYRR